MVRIQRGSSVILYNTRNYRLEVLCHYMKGVDRASIVHVYFSLFAEAGAVALIAFLKNAGASVRKGDMLVGNWLRLFTSIEDSPRGARLIAKNRPYSEHSIDRLKGLYNIHMKDNPFMELFMSEVETRDALAFINRMGLRRLEGGRYKNKKEQPQMTGTETFAKLVKFVRMAFKEYGRERHYRLCG